MKKPRRMSEALLPRSPLEFAHPLHVRGPGAEGAAILAELPPADAAAVLRLLRLVLAFSRGPEGAAVLRRDALERWEAHFHARPGHPLWGPAITILAQLGAGEGADAAMIAQSCVAVADWLLEAGAWQSALLFAEAAALAYPQNARMAWMAGRMLRNYGRMREAELWLRRAYRVAAWTRDVETQDLALNSLGNLFAQQGCFKKALAILKRALKLAQRLTKERRGCISHDLLLVYIGMGEYGRAERIATEAIKLYGMEHKNLPKLAHDIALLWMRQQKFLLALPVLVALLPSLTLGHEQLRVLASIACAAGAAGDRDRFDTAWAGAWELVSQSGAETRYFLPEVLADLGSGAAALNERAKALIALARSFVVACELERHDVTTRTEAILEKIMRNEYLVERAGPSSPAAVALSDTFVRVLVALSGTTVVIGGGAT